MLIEYKMIKCVKCDREFKSKCSLARHINRKVPCNEPIKCKKCGKEFKQFWNLKKHLERKITCDPVAGDPTANTPENTCHFCYKKFGAKRSLKRHFTTCKTRHNPSLIYKKIMEIQEKKELENKKIQEKILKRQTDLENENKELRRQLEAKGIVKPQTVVEGNVENLTNNDYSGHIETINNYNITNNITIIANNTLEYTRKIAEILKREDFQKIMSSATPDDTVVILKKMVRAVTSEPEVKNAYCPDTENDDMLVYQHDLKTGNCSWNVQHYDTFSNRLFMRMQDSIVSMNTSHPDFDKIRTQIHLYYLANRNNGETFPDGIHKLTPSEISELKQEIKEGLKMNTLPLGAPFTSSALS